MSNLTNITVEDGKTQEFRDGRIITLVGDTDNNHYDRRPWAPGTLRDSGRTKMRRLSQDARYEQAFTSGSSFGSALEAYREFKEACVY